LRAFRGEPVPTRRKALQSEIASDRNAISLRVLIRSHDPVREGPHVLDHVAYVPVPWECPHPINGRVLRDARIDMPAAITGSACVLQRMSHMRGDRKRNGPSGDPHPSWWRARYSWLSLAVAVAGLIVSASAWFTVSHWENQLAAVDLRSRASAHDLALQSGINAYLRKVSGLRALFESSQHVSRAAFDVFAKRIMDDQNAILGMSWVPRVPQDQRLAHERAAALDGIPSYQIKSIAPDGSMAPSPEKSEYFPVLHTSPEAPGLRVYGLDLNDGGVRQETLEHARDNDAMATSPLFTLQSGTGHRRGFFVALPVYAPGVPHETIEERNHNLRGYVQAVFQTSTLIEAILGATRKPEGLDLYWYSSNAGHDPSELIYFHGSRLRTAATEPLPRAALSAGPHWTGTLHVGDARWTMIAVPIPGGPGTAFHLGAWIALILCLFLSAIVASYLGNRPSRPASPDRKYETRSSNRHTQCRQRGAVSAETGSRYGAQEHGSGLHHVRCAGADRRLQRPLHRDVRIVARDREGRLLVARTARASGRGRTPESRSVSISRRIHRRDGERGSRELCPRHPGRSSNSGCEQADARRRLGLHP
jgi:CHASE1-domain containing sensor protein